MFHVKHWGIERVPWPEEERMPIPEGWEFWTSEPDEDDAWDLAVQYKQQHERTHSDLFVRVQVVKVPRERAWWILRRVETREATE